MLLKNVRQNENFSNILKMIVKIRSTIFFPDYSSQHTESISQKPDSLRRKIIQIIIHSH